MSSRASSLTDRGIEQQQEGLHINWLEGLKAVVIVTNQEQAFARQAVPQGSMSYPFLEYLIGEAANLEHGRLCSAWPTPRTAMARIVECLIESALQYLCKLCWLATTEDPACACAYTIQTTSEPYSPEPYSPVSFRPAQAYEVDIFVAVRDHR